MRRRMECLASGTAIFAIVVLLSLVGSAPADVADTPDGNALVAASLVADTAAVEPGKPFRVGVVFKINPGWHVYWINPGDSGVATDVQWKLPPGFTAGPLQWPVPDKFDLPGGIVNYGYEGEVMLFATITPPAKLQDEKLSLSAEASWLVCTEEQCLPGSASAALQLQAGTASAANKDQFDRWQGRLPVPVGDERSPIRSVPPAAGADVLGTYEWKDSASPAPTDVELFVPPGEVGVRDATIETDGRQITVRGKLDAKSSAEAAAIIGYRDGRGVRRGVEVPLRSAGLTKGTNGPAGSN